MKHKWQYFYKSRIQPTVDSPSSTINTGNNSNAYSFNSSDNLHPQHFLSIMNAYGHALVSDRDPNIVRNVLISLQHINERWRLYQRAYFREHLLSSFQAATLNVLFSGEGSGSLHFDLLAEVLFNLAQVDNAKMRSNLIQAVTNLPINMKCVDEICSISVIELIFYKYFRKNHNNLFFLKGLANVFAKTTATGTRCTLLTFNAKLESSFCLVSINSNGNRSNNSINSNPISYYLD